MIAMGMINWAALHLSLESAVTMRPNHTVGGRRGQIGYNSVLTKSASHDSIGFTATR